MSFFSNIKKALGFGPESDGDDFMPSQPEAGQRQQSDNADPVAPEPKVDPEVANRKIMASPEMVHMIFDHVVRVTNASVPAYLRDALDPEKQKQHLYDTLDASIKQYIASLEAEVNEKCRAQWKNEREQLRTEAEKLRQRADTLENRRAELKENVLSADRQRRALNERINDLESKLSNLVGEKEQLDLEKQSLMNKVKVLGVLEKQIEELTDELNQLRQRTPDEKLAQENAELQQRISQLTEQVASLSEAADAANVKDAMNSAMFNHLQQRASESIKAKEDAQSSIDGLKTEISLRDAKIDDLNKLLAERDAQISELEETMEGVQEIADQLDRFEVIKKRMEDTIRTLKANLRDAQRENETLRSTIRNNNMAYDEKERALNDRINQLSSSSHID